jgi:hypothetical protein
MHQMDGTMEAVRFKLSRAKGGPIIFGATPGAEETDREG